MYDVTFVPQEKMPHFLDIQFNEENVPGSPYEIEVRGPNESDVNGSGEMRNTKSGSTTALQGAVGSRSNGDVKGHGNQRMVEEGLKNPSSAPPAIGLAGTPNISTFEWPIPLNETNKVEVKVTGKENYYYN